MSMTTTNTPPHPRETGPMTDTKNAPKADVKPEPKQATASNLAPAGESGDPAVQKLLADRQAHVMNIGEDDPQIVEQRKTARAAIDEIDKKLADLGYAAK